MLHPLTLSRIEDALSQPGCPVCWEVERLSRTYLRRLLREHKGSEAVWQRLRESWGLCRAHTRGLLSQEARTIAGFSTATLYRWLAEALLSEATRGRRRFRALLQPRGGCLACQQLEAYERAVIGGLVRTLAAGDRSAVREAYQRGDGLCLPHLRIALDVADHPGTADLLTEHFCDSLRALAGSLQAFLEAHTPDGAGQGEVDSDVWLRAAERFSGRLR